MIFNIFFAIDVLAINIKGDVDANLIKTINQYYERNGTQNLNVFLKLIGFDNFTLNDNELILRKENKIKKIVIKGNIVFLDSTLKRISGIREGIFYKDLNMDKAKRNIEKFYLDNGYAKGHVKEIYFKNGVVFIRVFEGKLYIVDNVLIESKNVEEKKIPFLKFTNDKGIGLPSIAGMDITPRIYNKDTVKYYRDKLNKVLNEHGFFDSVVEYYIKKSKINHPFINRKVPFSSLLSILPFFHRSVNLIFRINYGPHYDLEIHGIKGNMEVKIREIVYKNLNKIDIFNIRDMEYKINQLLLKNFYMEPEVNTKILDSKINIYITYKKVFDRVDYNIKYEKHAKNTFVDIFIKNHKLFTTDKRLAEQIKNFITSNLELEGYYKSSVSIGIDDKNSILFIKGDVKEGSLYKIGNIVVNDEVFKKDLKLVATEKNIHDIQKKVEDELSKRYIIFNINLLEKKIDENSRKINLFFKADIKNITLKDVYIYKKLVASRMIKRFFEKNKKITSNKISKVRETLGKQPQISAYNIRPLNNDNKTVDLVVHTEEAPKNQVYGSFGYDNVDKLRFTLGYRRKNFLHSLHMLEASGGITTKEEGFRLSLVGFDVLGKQLNDIVSYSFNDRDEDEYEYMMSRFSLGLNKFGNKYFLGATIYYENLDIRDTVFAKEIEDKFLKNYNNMGLNIDYKYFMVDNKLSPANGAIVDIKLTPVNFFKDSDFYKSEIALSLYKTILDKVLLVGNGDFGAIAGKNKNIPLPYRFTLGGPKRMKAFDYRDIGSEDEDGEVYGGKYYYYGIVYAGYKLAPLVYIGPFYEIGSAFDSFNDVKSYNDAGAMLDLKTNVGSFIMSYAVNTKNSEKSKSAFYITFETTF
jgi:outer membrane protein assembly factor BamA